MSDQLYAKYTVIRNDGKPVTPAFVLEPEKDPCALFALQAYKVAAEWHGKPGLAEDLGYWIRNIKDAHK